MRRRKGIIAALLSLSVLSTIMLGCSGSDMGTEKGIKSVSSGKDSADDVDDADSADSKDSSDKSDTNATDASIEEQVLFEANDIKITALELDDGLFGTDLKLLIENNSGQNVTVQAENANVNGYMVSTLMSTDVASGKKANDSLTFETSGLKECGIESIATMEFSFNIFDTDSWDDIVKSDVIKIDTSIAGSYSQTYDDSGEVLVDSNGIKIVGKGLSTEDSFWGPGLILYIENNSDQNVTIQANDVSVNGFMVESLMSEDIVAGKKAISAVQFFDSDLEENSITDISNIELYFNIFNLETWDDIFDSDVINLEF